jgi:hypothetical protein
MCSSAAGRRWRALVSWAIVGRKQFSFTRLMLPLLLGGLLALPALWWGLALTRDVDPQIVADANKLYVLERLPHHLYPPKFAAGFVQRHLLTMLVTAGLLALLTGFPWAYMQRPRKRVVLDSGSTGSARATGATGFASAVADDRIEPDTGRASGAEYPESDQVHVIQKAGWQALAVFVMTAAGIALAGMALLNLFPAEDPRLLALLRYYWFRASDIYVPLGAALATWRLVELLIHGIRCRRSWPMWGFAACWSGTRPSRSRTGRSRSRAFTRRVWTRGRIRSRRSTSGTPADWRELGQWIRANTPSNAKFLTPRQGRTFKWHAQRAEVVTNKDIPQDAPAIMHWWGVQDEIFATHSGDPEKRWHRSLGLLPVERLRELADKYGAEYVVIHYRPGVPEFPLPPLYRKQDVWGLSARAE